MELKCFHLSQILDLIILFGLASKVIVNKRNINEQLMDPLVFDCFHPLWGEVMRKYVRILTLRVFPGAAASVWWQYQRPSEGGSPTLHHGYSMKTPPASCWLCSLLHLIASPVYSLWIDCYWTHTYTQYSHACTETNVCTNLYHQWPLIPPSPLFTLINNAVTLPCVPSGFCVNFQRWLAFGCIWSWMK